MKRNRPGPMKLLYLAPHQIWPINSGARLRNYQLVRQLPKEIENHANRSNLPPR
jgi:hypothetical protein